MSIRTSVVVLLSSIVLAACGGAHGEAKEPDSDPWAGYTGKYSDQAAPREAAPSKAEKKAKAKADAEAAAAAEQDKTEQTAKKSRGAIGGESVSSVGVDALADASKTALKAKVVSSKVVVGPQYEEVDVQLKGADVKIIRPASSPNPSGPSVGAPKDRQGELGKNESGWYDEFADVLVVVKAGKKGKAQKALGSMLKR